MTRTPHAAMSTGAEAADIAQLVQQGTAALDEGDLRLALERFGQVVAAFPDRPEGHNNLGALYSSLGELEQAEACFGKVIGLLPDNPHVLYNRGVVRSRREDYAGAEQDFQRAAVLAPQDADIENNLGVTAYLQGQPDRARHHFQRALQLRPDYDNALLNLCDLQADTGDLVAAVATCQEYLSRLSSATVRHKLFQMQRRAGSENLAQATRTAEALLVADPDNAALRRELGTVLQARDTLAEAAAEAQATG